MSKDAPACVKCGMSKYDHEEPFEFPGPAAGNCSYRRIELPKAVAKFTNKSKTGVTK